MKLLIGLGNPGEKYVNTRHNVGFMVIGRLAKLWELELKLDKKFESLVALKKTGINAAVLARPQTFMNQSGSAVKSLVRFYKVAPSDLYVVHDDLDITLGNYKIQLGKGPKVHNGLNSIYEKLGSKDFWHIRIGVDSRVESSSKISGERYVLQTFEMNELQTINSIIDEVVKKIIGKI